MSQVRYICAVGAQWAQEVAIEISSHVEGVEIIDIRGERIESSASRLKISGRRTLSRLLTANTSPRYVFFLNWSRRVKDEIVNGLECINFHCTPLPYGRGGGPIENMILDRYTDTVITAHRMTSELDAGPIYGTRGPISLAGSKVDIQRRFIAPVAELIRWIVETEPVPKPQEGKPTYFRRLKPSQYTEFWRARG